MKKTFFYVAPSAQFISIQVKGMILNTSTELGVNDLTSDVIDYNFFNE